MNSNICKLCGQMADLRNSHVIPEFMYKPLYDEKHRFLGIPVDGALPGETHQKGFRERMFCGLCEGKLANWERYVRDLFFMMPGEKDFPLRIDQSDDGIALTGIDYSSLRFFQLSILWRASVSSLNIFADVDLGPYQETVRQLLVREDPAKASEFPCVMLVLLKGPNSMLNEAILRPDRMRDPNGYRFYRFVFGGVAWIFYISLEKSMITDEKYVCSPDGTLTLPTIDARSTNLFQELATRISRRRLDK